MSRWLKSVNNLLETLDGKVETAADGAGPDAFGKLLENGREAVSAGLGTRRKTSVGSVSSDDDEDDDDDYDDDDDDDDDDDYDFDNDGDDNDYGEDGDANNDSGDEEDHYEEIEVKVNEVSGALEENAGDEKPGVVADSNTKIPNASELEQGIAASALPFATATDRDPERRHTRHDSLSDLSTSKHSEKEREDMNEELKPPATRDVNHKKIASTGTAQTSLGGNDSTGSGDFIPNLPSRQKTFNKEVRNTALSSSDNTNNSPSGRKARRGKKIFTAQSPTKIDISPRFPRRSIEVGEEESGRLAAGPSLLEDDDNNSVTDGGVAVGGGKSGSPEAPPQAPLRKASLFLRQPNPEVQPMSASIASTDPRTSHNNSDVTTALLPSSQKTGIPKPPASGNPKSTKEYQKLKEKLQHAQAQLAKTSSELKTSQTEIKLLQTQNQTLASKLEAANSEIQAQGDELRRAAERIEKDRLRAQEEREDLLDEQDEELGQLTQAHQKELDGLRSQYEKQIAELTEQLHSEETRRRQEGGDYTQELQDAVERERDALKKLSVVTLEKTQSQSMVSKLEQQMAALQGKLDSALQSVKTAAEREREAEDKLDAAMALHSRQMRQRQSREAELERTIFDLGTALTVARQKQQNPSLMSPIQSTSDKEGDSFRDKYIAAAEEVETLKVQWNMETQRREALQEELNEISRERTEEISSAQARQRLHDRKVSELESTISRLQTASREQKSTLLKASGNEGADLAVLSPELQSARQEIESLTTQLLRQQNMVESSKSEVLALKGRLQAASSRAEQAEELLQAAQSLQSSISVSNDRLYEMEGGGAVIGGMRRRIKGGTNRARNRSIRAALQISPARSNHPIMEQVVMTLDALDNWMVTTGTFLRHEPLARLAFMLYLLTLHLWSFALVVFHTMEQPHGDFGSMDNNPRHWRATALAQQTQT